MREWLTSQNYPQDKTDKIVAIVEGISFKNELGGAKHPQSIELDIVRDADRLDAIGAVGKNNQPDLNPDHILCGITNAYILRHWSHLLLRRSIHHANVRSRD